MKTFTIILLLFTAHLRAQDVQRAPATSLSAKMASAFEAKAESKVIEFYSYLELISDPIGDLEMKQQATEEAVKMFLPNTRTDNIFEPKTAYVAVTAVLESARRQSRKQTFSISNFAVERGKETAIKKEWKIYYQLTMNGLKYHINQQFYIIQEDKKFGTITKRVTNTYLGAMTIR